MNATKSRQPVKPVHGSCRWVKPIRWPFPGVLGINGTAYTVIPQTGDRSGPAAPVLGYRLVNQASRKAYDIDAEFWVCDCPDATYRSERPGGCKHVAALKAALRSIGL
jgi:hypothetical protein